MAISDTYMKRPYSPAADLLQQQNAAGESVARNGAAAMEYRHQQRPVTPWQKAVMRLMQGHDPRQVAADTKGELGGGMGAQPSLGGVGGPVAGGAAVQMPRPDSDQTNYLGGLSKEQYAGGMTGMAAPRGVPAGQPMGGAQGGGLSDTMFEGMTNRDFGDYTNAMNHMRQQKYHKTITDEMELQRLKNKGSLDVANVGGESRKEVAKTNSTTKKDIAEKRAQLDTRRLDLRQKADELRARIEDKKLDEKTAHHLAQIQLGYDSLMQKHSEFMSKSSQTDRLEMAKLLVKDANAQEANFAKVEASLAGLVGMDNPDLVSDLAEKRKSVAAAKKQAQEEIQRQKNAAPSTGDTETRDSKNSVPAGVKNPAKSPPPSKKWSVGEKFMSGGKEREVTAVNAQGQVTNYTPFP